MGNARQHGGKQMTAQELAIFFEGVATENGATGRCGDVEWSVYIDENGEFSYSIENKKTTYKRRGDLDDNPANKQGFKWLKELIGHSHKIGQKRGA